MLVDRSRYIDIPWMCVGDFNDILYHYEKEGGDLKLLERCKDSEIWWSGMDC